MRGHLKSLILRMLDQKPMSGSQIIKELETTMNWKPSCGSIYPMLNNLEKEGLTTFTMEKSKKNYSLTKKGQNFIKEKQEEKEELIQSLEKSYMLLESVYGFNTEVEREMLEEIKNGEMPFQEVFEESMMLKEEITRLKKENKLKNNTKKIKQTLLKAVKELKKI